MPNLSRALLLRKNLTPTGVNMSKFIKCGPAVFHLRDFCNKSPFSTWQWKLDPFITASPSSAVTEIDLNKTTVSISGATAVSCEKDGFFSREVLRTDSGMLWTLRRNSSSETVISVFADESDNIRLVEDKTETSGKAAFEFVGRIAVRSMLKNSVITFHGVLMEYNGRGIIITAPSETGKTTHARLWRDEKNALIINGDNACCYKENGKWKGFGIPWSGTSGENINRETEIAALVILQRGEKNKAFRMNEYDAFKGVLPMIHYPSWDIEKTQIAVDLCNDFLKDIPVFGLGCRPDSDSVEVLHKALEDVL